MKRKISESDVSSVRRVHLTGITTVDFNEERFDGDYRKAHLYVPFIQDKFDSQGLAYVLDPTFALTAPTVLIQQKKLDTERRTREYEEYQLAMTIWKARPTIMQCDLFATFVGTLSEGGPKVAALQALAQLRQENSINFPTPIQQPFVSILSSSNESEISSFDRDSKKEKSHSDIILALFKNSLGPSISTEMAVLWDDPTIPSVTKARYTWDHVKKFRTCNAESTVTNIKADVSNLPTATTIFEARRLHQQIGVFQLQLTTIGAAHAYSDTALVSILRSKMIGDNFSHLKFYLRTKEGGSSVPSLQMPGTQLLPTEAATNPLSWRELGDLLKIAGEETQNGAAASTSMLDLERPTAAYASHASYGREHQQQRSEPKYYPPQAQYSYGYLPPRQLPRSQPPTSGGYHHQANPQPALHPYKPPPAYRHPTTAIPQLPRSLQQQHPAFPPQAPRAWQPPQPPRQQQGRYDLVAPQAPTRRQQPRGQPSYRAYATEFTSEGTCSESQPDDPRAYYVGEEQIGQDETCSYAAQHEEDDQSFVYDFVDAYGVPYSSK